MKSVLPDALTYSQYYSATLGLSKQLAYYDIRTNIVRVWLQNFPLKVIIITTKCD